MISLKIAKKDQYRLLITPSFHAATNIDVILGMIQKSQRMKNYRSKHAFRLTFTSTIVVLVNSDSVVLSFSLKQQGVLNVRFCFQIQSKISLK